KPWVVIDQNSRELEIFQGSCGLHSVVGIAWNLFFTKQILFGSWVSRGRGRSLLSSGRARDKDYSQHQHQDAERPPAISNHILRYRAFFLDTSRDMRLHLSPPILKEKLYLKESWIR